MAYKNPCQFTSIKVYHDNDEMTWTKSKLYKKFFNNGKSVNKTFDTKTNYNVYDDNQD